MGRKTEIILVSAVLFLLILILPISASHILNPKLNETYNLGDTVVITGTISLNQEALGAEVEFYAKNVPFDKSVLLTKKYYSFPANTPVTFSQISKNTMTWAIPSDTQPSDKWEIVVEVTKGTINLNYLKSNQFKITDQLDLLVGLNSYSYNLGDSLEVSGTIIDSHGFQVDGVANTFLEGETGTSVTDSVQVENGYLEYNYNFNSADLPGLYSLKIEFKDTDGNIGSETISDIEVSNVLGLTCNVQKTEILPGGNFVITGNIKNVNNKPVANLGVSGLVTDPAETTTLKYDASTDANGVYAFTVNMPKLAAPGYYSINVETSDLKGNSGQCQNTVSVGTIKSMNISLNLETNETYEDSTLGYYFEISNDGNVELSGTLGLYLNDALVKSTVFSIEQGVHKTINDSWVVVGSVGGHTIKAIAVSEGERLIETEPQQFTILASVSYDIFSWYNLLILFVVMGALILYLKRQNIVGYAQRRTIKKTAQLFCD